MNVIQSLLKSAQQPPQSLHSGEVFALWTLYTGAAESRAICMLMINHTNDTALKEEIEHFIADVEEPLIKKLKQLLAHEGIGIPPTTGDKPRANEAAIPAGAKMTDTEIANLLVIKLGGLLNICHQGILQALRDDVGVLLLGTYQHLVTQAFTLKTLMREHGWLRIPPSFPVPLQTPANT